MLQTLLHQNVFLYGIVGVGVAGVLLKLLLHSRYRRLLFAAENMSLTDQKMFKNLRGKFEDTYMKNMKINHMTSFIHKNLYRQKFLGVTYSFWNHMNQQILLLIAAVAAAGSLYLWTGGMDSEVWKLLCAATITASVVQMTELWIGNPELWDMIHTNLEFFFANFLQNKYEQERSDEKGRSIAHDMDYLKSCISEIASTRENGDRGLSKKELGVVEDILNEFFA